MAPDPLTALAVDLGQPDLGVGIVQRLDFLQGGAAGSQASRHLDVEAPRTTLKEELPTPSNQDEIFFSRKFEKDCVDIVHVDRTGGIRHGSGLRLVALVQFLPRQAVLQDKAFEAWAVHERDAELLGHSLRHGFATAFGLTGDRDDPHGGSPLQTGMNLDARACCDVGQLAHRAPWKIIPSGQG
jgi:hypothetical protein